MKFDSMKLAVFLDKHRNCKGTFKIMKNATYIKVRCMDCGEVENISLKEENL